MEKPEPSIITHAMTEPIGAPGGRRTELRGDHLDEGLQDGEGQSLASFAVSCGAESPPSELDDVLTGGVAVEDLEQEK